jgi:hypothetical protein
MTKELKRRKNENNSKWLARIEKVLVDGTVAMIPCYSVEETYPRNSDRIIRHSVGGGVYCADCAMWSGLADKDKTSLTITNEPDWECENCGETT